MLNFLLNKSVKAANISKPPSYYILKGHAVVFHCNNKKNVITENLK